MRILAALTATFLLPLVAGCEAPKPPPYTVTELAGDAQLLQGIAARCAADKHAATDVECTNARLAIERVAAEGEAKRTAEHDAAFERQRERRRLQDEQSARAAERAQPGFDPYSSPVATDKAADPAKP